MSTLVVLLCGIPGSGKSTFSQRLVDLLTDCDVAAFTVSFDAIGESTEWNESSFKAIREESLAQLRSLLGDTSDSSERKVVIVDDIMHLRSMRRQVYQVSRDNRCPLLCVWLKTAVPEAWERNSQRPRDGKLFVSEEAFHKIVETFQPPDADHVCDRYHVVADHSNTEIDWVHSVINESLLMLENPSGYLTSVSDTTNVDLSSARISEPSKAKIYDEILRNIVANLMKAACQSSETTKDRKKLSALAAFVKSIVFQELKCDLSADQEFDSDSLSLTNKVFARFRIHWLQQGLLQGIDENILSIPLRF